MNESKIPGTVYAHIVQTLIRAYRMLYYIDLETEEYTEYRIDEKTDTLIETKSKTNFFDRCLEIVPKHIHPDDRELYIKAINRENILKTLERDKTFMLTFKAIVDGRETFANVKAALVPGNERYLVIGVSNVDKQTKQRKLDERLQEERIAYTRINALTGDFICIYVIIPESGLYREYSATDAFREYKLPREGEDFFAASRENGKKVVYPGDLDRYLAFFTRENIMEEVACSGYVYDDIQADHRRKADLCAAESGDGRGKGRTPSDRGYQ